MLRAGERRFAVGLALLAVVPAVAWADVWAVMMSPGVVEGPGLAMHVVGLAVLAGAATVLAFRAARDAGRYIADPQSVPRYCRGLAWLALVTAAWGFLSVWYGLVYLSGAVLVLLIAGAGVAGNRIVRRCRLRLAA